MSNAIEKLPREQLAKMAVNMRRRARNEALDRARMVQRLLAVGVGTGAAYGMGMFMAGKEKEYATNAAAIEAGTMEDPRKLAGVDIEIVAGGGASLLGIVLQGKSGSRKIGEIAEAAGVGVLSFWAGQKGLKAGMEAA